MAERVIKSKRWQNGTTIFGDSVSDKKERRFDCTAYVFELERHRAAWVMQVAGSRKAPLFVCRQANDEGATRSTTANEMG